MKCRKCQFENSEGMNFCGKCGARLHYAKSGLKPLPEQTKPRLISEPERKHVTAFFSDLTEYT